MTTTELFQLMLSWGVVVCPRCDPADDHTVAMLTRRYGGDCVHVCRNGRDAYELARHLIGPETDPDDHILINGTRSVAIAAVADTAIMSRSGGRLNAQ
ncbi:MAG: hypothetical protein JWM53_2459 [bacterium]|nr:hypothetical protein [bacterium]